MSIDVADPWSSMLSLMLLEEREHLPLSRCDAFCLHHVWFVQRQAMQDQQLQLS